MTWTQLKSVSNATSLEWYGDMNFEDYLAQVPQNRVARLNSFLELVRQMYPQAVESMKYKMPTFTWGANWIAVGNQKNYMSIYTCMEEHIAAFKRRHPKIKTGKGCINFRDQDCFPLDDLMPVITHAMEYQHSASKHSHSA